MNNQWMRKTLLAISINVVIGGAYAAETIVPDVDVEDTTASAAEELSSTEVTEAVANTDAIVESVSSSAEVSPTVETASVESNQVVQPVSPKQAEASINKDETPSLKPQGEGQAANALQQKEGDATQETNLQEVFTSNERHTL